MDDTNIGHIEIHEDDLIRMQDCIDFYEEPTVVVCGHPDTPFLGMLFYLMAGSFEQLNIYVDDVTYDNACAKLTTWTGDTMGWPDRDFWAVFPVPLSYLMLVLEQERYSDNEEGSTFVALNDKSNQLRGILRPNNTWILMVCRNDDDSFCLNVIQNSLGTIKQI